MRKYLYTPTTPDRQGSLWFSHRELRLDPAKNYVTEKRFPDIFSDTGFINLGDRKHIHDNAKVLAAKLLDGMENAVIFFLTASDSPKPFVCYKDEAGAVVLRTIGYFDYASTVFEKFNWDRDYLHTGLIEEIDDEGHWDIIEE